LFSLVMRSSEIFFIPETPLTSPFICQLISSSNLLLFLFLGDILGLAMQNLENLLQMPYGCGEQNIALLASDTYVLDYLKSTQQLTEEVKSKAFFFLSNGYQKQLSFKNFDGSYSVFWQKNQKGSIWLSALTFKTLERMKEYVYIDEHIQRETLIWLSSKQNINGCFESDGKVFNNAWEGGEEENILFTAYVVGAFLEAGLNFTFPALRNGLFCLEEALEDGVTNGYIHAILAYAFALAEREKQVESLLQILDQSATKTNNVIYWERAKKPKTDTSPSFIPHAPSAETEKTCYVLLAVLSKKTPDLTYASRIVQWLAQQMNSHGGFSSTQDTAVCLLAITHYMKFTFSNDQNTVTLSGEESNEMFQVNGDNRLLVQRSELTKAHGQYTLDVEGQGCVTLRNNVLLPKKASGFSLSLEIIKKNSSDTFQRYFDLIVTLK
uniref:Alpha-macroglobulin-like TED domain-containing protein n=1 Tax=Canis lupus familiaris TaxID=9615 RepID=A0A8P0NFF0_CANLF